MKICQNYVINPANKVKIAFGTWQLIGFSASTNVNGAWLLGNVFAGDSRIQTYYAGKWAYGFENSKFLRIGGATTAWIGDISSLRIITPGSSYIPESRFSIIKPY